MSAPASTTPSRTILIGYYAVQFGKTILWVAADLIAFYVLATVEHLPAHDISLVLIGGLAWHALSDMAVGQWLERRGCHARSLAIVAGIAVPVACFTFVLSLLLALHRPWAALAAMMVSRSAYALFDVPHHALVGRMARRGWPAVRIVGIRNLWGQIASLLLGLGLAPVLGPVMQATQLALVLAVVAGAAGAFSLPIIILIRQLWDASAAREAIEIDAARRPASRIGAVLLLHLWATTMIATTSKLALSAVAPGVALATLSIGRITASIPVPARWRERHVGLKLGTSALTLIVAVMLLLHWTGPGTLFCFGLASGWINILTWAWLGRNTEQSRPFALAAMLTKIGLLTSIALASTSVP